MIGWVGLGLSTKWVDRIIELKPKYLVYNSGAWWNDWFVRVRGEWCNYEEWENPTREYMVRVYTEVMEQTILPLFTSLLEDHGIIPVWMDTPPAGIVDLETGELAEQTWAHQYKMFPRFNEIGREIVTTAGGLVLPLWDVTIPRWQDHVFSEHDNNDDQLHFCTHIENAIPAVWARLLEQVLYGDRVDSDEAIQSARLSEPVDILTPGNATTVSNEKSSQAESGPIVLLSKSHLSSCQCSLADDYKRCRANIRCSWDDETGVCLERD